MSDDRIAGALAIWHARNLRSAGDRAFLAYAVVMVLLVAVAPAGRLVWLAVTTPEAIAALTSPSAPEVTTVVVAALWAGALLWGRDRGPALLAPFPTYALGAGGSRRSRAFRGAVLRAGAVVTAGSVAGAGLIAGSLMSHGATGAVGVAVFATAGALVGIIASIAWLAGQALPRAAAPMALAVLVLGALSAAVPLLQPFTPWGWVAMAYPADPSHAGLALAAPLALTALAASAAALVALAPRLMARLALERLIEQAVRWESATNHATIMDFSAAVTAYRRVPHRGRRIRAITPVRLPLAFLIRDAIGAARTPGRLVGGVLAVAVAGVLITLAVAPDGTVPGWVVGAAAGVLLFGGLGPLTDGVRHAVSVASDLPLYGIADERLLALHVLFPLAASAVVLVAVVVACSIVAGAAAGPPALVALALGLLTSAVRVGAALKGGLPPALLAPIPTPMGDFGAAVRMVWAIDGVLLAALAGAGAALASASPVLLVAVAVVVVAVGIRRWRARA
ncbi:hypothetical protein GE115_10820 [Agromyces sp. CFH 90414]|uniref:Uncharacterized protein n=1 Tax=Agromyces agglutinans TaxID=2662258 RepID=A0A6I2FEM9_9MICO|nr:hypothetical protein [Agromyces agglutinans]MRG60353.1 hypothetical protein [Agromyces agglutinans]